MNYSMPDDTPMSEGGMYGAPTYGNEAELENQMFIVKLYQNQMEDYWVESGKDLLSSLRECGCDPISDCGGCGGCGKCKARLVMGGLSPATEAELKYLTNMELTSGWFLLCQRRPLSDLIIDLPQRDQPFYQMERADLLAAEPLDPMVKKVVFQLPTGQPSLRQALLAALAAEQVQTVALSALKQLSRLAAEPQLTAVIAQKPTGNEVLAVEARDTTGQLYGLAVDLGSCTIGVRLLDLAQGKLVGSGLCGNSQRAFGATLADRIAYTGSHPQGEKSLKQVAVDSVNQLIEALCQRAEIDPKQIYTAAVAGNAVMEHLLLGLCPQPPEQPPVFRQAPLSTAHQVGFAIFPLAAVLLLPSQQAAAGGDVTAAMAALQAVYRQSGPVLLVDVGTQTELVLRQANGDLQAVAVQTPVLEGMNLQMGMTASDGSVFEVYFDEEKQDLTAKWQGDMEAKGISGMGLLAVVAALQKLGVVLPDGSFAAAEQLPEAVGKRLRLGQNGLEFVLAGYGLRVVVLTERDCKNLLQTATTLRTAAKQLLEQAGVKPEQCRTVVTGAFGSQLPLAAAASLELLPAALFARLQIVPDAVITGAQQYLLHCNQWQLAKE